MKKFFVIFLLIFSTYLFAGKLISLRDKGCAEEKIAVILDFPENVSKRETKIFKQDLSEYRGFKKIFDLNVGKPDKKYQFFYYFVILGPNTDFKYLKKVMDIPENSVFSKTKIKLGSKKVSGSNLSAVLRVKNGVICLAHDIEGLDKIFSYSDTGFSAVIFDNKKPLTTWFYDDKYSFINCEIPMYYVFKDFDYFFKSLKEIHPCLLNNMDIDAFIDLQVDSYTQLTKCSRDGYVRVKDFLKLLYKSAAFFNDGHTSVDERYYVTNKNSRGCGFLPFFLEQKGENFYIKEVIKKQIPEKFIGAKILTLNGKTPWDFFKPIFDMCSAEGKIFKARGFMNAQAFYYSLSEMLKLNQKVSVKTDKGEFEVNCIDADTFQQLAKTIKKEQKEIQVKFYDKGRIAYFYLPEFDYTKEYRDKIDDFFNKVFEKKSEAIIFDIRNNGGGNSNLADYIISHLTDKPYKTFSAANIKLSKPVMEKFYPFYSQKYDLEGIGEFFSVGPTKHFSFDKVFKGKVYVLIDGGVFSTATAFSAIVKDYKLATLIGYETGGRPTSYGDFFPMSLPFTNIFYGISWKKFYRAKYSPETENRGVLPDVPLNDEMLKPFRKEKDPFLAFTLNYVRKEIE